MAMETISDDAACIFMFTKGSNLQYTIGVSNIRFQNLDSMPQHSQQQPLQRLKKVDIPVNKPAIKAESKPQTIVKESPVQVMVEEERKENSQKSQKEEEVAVVEQVHPEEDDDATRDRKIKRENFYKEVDNEEFF